MTYALSPHVRASLEASNRRIVITGAGGWLGLATLELLSEALGPALDDRVACFGASRRTLTLMDGRTIEQQPLDVIGKLAAHPSLVLHFAFLTKDRAENMFEADYRHSNRALSQRSLEALDAIDARGVFVASSGAAHFVDDTSRSAPMRLYGELKQADEELFADWAVTRSRTAVIARLFNIAGPHINKVRSYALSSFLLDALELGAVHVHAPHRVVRGYVAIRELMSLAFTLLLAEKSGVTSFDTGGQPMELGEVGAFIATHLAVPFQRAEMTSVSDDTYVGDASEYARLLRDQEIQPVTFVQQVEETLAYLKQTRVDGSAAAPSGVVAPDVPC